MNKILGALIIFVLLILGAASWFILRINSNQALTITAMVPLTNQNASKTREQLKKDQASTTALIKALLPPVSSLRKKSIRIIVERVQKMKNITRSTIRILIKIGLLPANFL